MVQIRHRRNREKGAALFMAVAALVWIVIPMLGLVVDLGILYSAKARLQAAVDGAALAAARALNLGQTTTTQAVSAQQNAVNWFYANFPTGNWATFNTVMTTANVIVINSPSNANLRQVTVTASTSVPTWFMKYLGLQRHQPYGLRVKLPARTLSPCWCWTVPDRCAPSTAWPGVQPCSKSNTNHCVRGHDRGG